MRTNHMAESYYDLFNSIMFSRPIPYCIVQEKK